MVGENDREYYRGGLGGIVEEQPVECTPEASASVDARTLVVRLAAALSAADEPGLLTQRALEIAVEAFGARGGSVSSAERDENDDLLLVVIAVAGPHTSLLGEIPPVSVAAATDASRVYRNGSPQFIENAYASAGGAEQTGAARWREQLSAQARAVLPVEVSGRRLGTLSLEWSSPRPFEDAEKELLAACASLIGLGLMRPDREALPEAEAPQPEHAIMRFEITPEGVVTVPRGGSEWGGASVRVTVRASASSLADVYVVAPGRVLILIVSVDLPDSEPDPELLEVLRHTARVLGARASARQTAAALADRLRELSAAGAAIDGWIGTWNPGAGALDHALLGTAHARLLLTDGRQLTADGDPHPTADTPAEAAETWLPLPGDVLHAWAPGEADVRVEWRGRATGR